MSNPEIVELLDDEVMEVRAPTPKRSRIDEGFRGPAVPPLSEQGGLGTYPDLELVSVSPREVPQLAPLGPPLEALRNVPRTTSQVATREGPQWIQPQTPQQGGYRMVDLTSDTAELDGPTSSPSRPNGPSGSGTRGAELSDAFTAHLDTLSADDRLIAQHANTFLVNAASQAKELMRKSRAELEVAQQQGDTSMYAMLLEMKQLILTAQEFLNEKRKELAYGRYATKMPLLNFKEFLMAEMNRRFGKMAEKRQVWHTERNAALTQRSLLLPTNARPSQLNSGSSHNVPRTGSFGPSLRPPPPSTIVPPPPLQNTYGGSGYNPVLDGDGYALGSRVDLEDTMTDMIDTIHKGLTPMNLPEALNVSILEHQRLGLAWLVSREETKHRGGILADDMGLGKTVQTIALIYARPPKYPPTDSRSQDLAEPSQTLIVCPLSLVNTWKRELEERVHPDHRLRVYVHHRSSNKSMFTRARDIKREADVVITTYDTMRLEFNAKTKRREETPHPLNQIKWWRVVLDEAHLIKNHKAQISLAACDLRAVHRLVLSGTPMQNRYEELWSLLRFLRIQPYWDSLPTFRKEIIGERNSATQPDQMQRLHALIASVLLRRKKDTVVNGRPILADLPEKSQKEHLVVMEGEEQQEYKDLETQTKKTAIKMMKNKVDSMNILTLLLRLRQASCHPLLSSITTAKKTSVAPVPNEYDVIDVRSLEETDLRSLALMDRDDRECRACGEIVTSDQVLAVLTPCVHFLCRDCANSLGQYYPDPHGESLGICPTCRSPARNVVFMPLVRLFLQHPEWSDAKIIAQLKRERQNILTARRLAMKSRKIRLQSLIDDGDSTGRRALDDSMDNLFDISDSDDEGFKELLESSLSDDGAMVMQDSGSSSPSPSVPLNPSPDVKPDLAPPNAPATPAMTPKEENGGIGEDADWRLDGKRDDPDAVPKDEPATSRVDQLVQVDEIDGDSELNVTKRGKAIEDMAKISIDDVASLFSVPGIFKEGWHSSAKVEALMEVLRDVWTEAPDDKVIVFSYFTSMLDVLTIPLDAARIDYLMYTGEMNAVERTEVLDRFQNTSTKVLLISLRAGNVGLTLTSANRVVLVEPFWNPYVEEQAKDRVHRIGQTKPVIVYRLLIKDTVETRIMELQKKKMEQIESALDPDSRDKVHSLNRDELRFLFGLGPRRRLNN